MAGRAATTPRQYSVGIAQGEGEPLQAARHAGNVSGALGATNAALGSCRAPALGQPDQVIAVGAVAVQQHHQRIG